MKRYLGDRIFADLHRKMVVLTGPRQVGKTYLARQMAERFGRPCYLNFDNPSDAAAMARQSWPSDIGLLVLDEIHKDLITLGAKMPGAKLLQLVRDLRVEEDRDGVSLRRLPEWLAGLEV